MVSTRAGDAGIWLTPPGAKARMLLSFKDVIPFGLSWSPDGADLAFVTLGAQVALHVIGAAGESVARIVVPGVRSGKPAWSADGREIIFPVRDGKGWRLWRAEVARPATAHPITGYGWAQVRAVGNAIYSSGHGANPAGIWRLDPAPAKIVDISPVFAGAWTVFKDRLVFPDDSDPKHPRLLSRLLSGGPTRPFADVPAIASDWSFDIDPRSGVPGYISAIDTDRNIELFHLVRR